ncbi:hypothetical protein LRP50_21675 [Enterovibrio sp. ZSDZ42]|uniref:Uncharacterized protein n=1 Tax=Enterovibrio gelatinilyticus TaxID=2899819 RepID=A0ABT5R6W5_9GAMM|nr:hypothetical protein [Enterovibrio sp. ZSDZ42]MDD1795734.1 hypothetical protein [Enterovibrio sp. ZSDZ42]
MSAETEVENKSSAASLVVFLMMPISRMSGITFAPAHHAVRLDLPFRSDVHIALKFIESER